MAAWRANAGGRCGVRAGARAADGAASALRAAAGRLGGAAARSPTARPRCRRGRRLRSRRSRRAERTRVCAKSWRRSPPSSAPRERRGATATKSCSTCSARPPGRRARRRGCELAGTQPFSRPMSAAGLDRLPRADPLAAGARRARGRRADVVEPVERAQRSRVRQPAASRVRADSPSLAPAVVRAAGAGDGRRAARRRRRAPPAARRAQRLRSGLAAPHEHRRRSSPRCPPTSSASSETWAIHAYAARCAERSRA